MMIGWANFVAGAAEIIAEFPLHIRFDVRLAVPGAVESLTELYTRYAELGGKYVTLGSDAHAAKAVGMHFDVAQKIAKTAGLTIVYYKKRQRQLPK